MASTDEAGKLFIGGIHRSTTQESLKNYFEKFGKVAECKLMIDKVTGNSRGFGFVTYVDPLSVNEVLLKKPHTLDNKMIDAKPCTTKAALQQKKTASSMYPKAQKIFLGGISMEATEDDVRSYFSRYGVVVEVTFVSDKMDPSRPHKGFGFVTFEDESSVDQAIAKHYHMIKNKRCEAKSAEQKSGGNQNGASNYYPPNMLGLVTGQQQQQQQQQGANAWMNGNMMNYGYGYPNQYSTAAATAATGATAQFTNTAYGYGYGATSQFNQMGQAQAQTMGQMMPGTQMPAANMAGTIPTAGSMAPAATGTMTNPAMGGMQHMGMQPGAVQPAANQMPQGNMGYQQGQQQGYGGPIRQGGHMAAAAGGHQQAQHMGGAQRGGGHGQGYHPYRR